MCKSEINLYMHVYEIGIHPRNLLELLLQRLLHFLQHGAPMNPSPPLCLVDGHRPFKQTIFF